MTMTRIVWEDYDGFRRVEWRDLDKVESIRFGLCCFINGEVVSDIRYVAAVARAKGIPVDEMGGELPVSLEDSEATIIVDALKAQKSPE